MSYSPLKKISIIFSLFLVVFSAAYFFKVKTENYFNSGSENLLKEIPSASVKLLSGESVDINKLKTSNRGLLVHFWGTWCGPCEVELPSLLAMVEGLKNSDIDFLLVAVRDDINKVQKFVKKFNMLNIAQIKVVLDEDGSVMSKFGTFKLPETYIFDKNGQSQRKFVGAQDWDNQYYKNQIQHLLTL